MGHTLCPFRSPKTHCSRIKRDHINTPSRLWTNQPPPPPHLPAGAAPKEAFKLAQETRGLHRHHTGGQGHHTDHQGGGPPAATTPSLLQPRSLTDRAHSFPFLMMMMKIRLWVTIEANVSGLNRCASQHGTAIERYIYISFSYRNRDTRMCDLRNAGLSY